ncbi:hypothetical protein [Pseudonocardia acidicola]|uniref:Uncharacterized protein n=1 Tax=Pseudonocardia acidicola TaxID=2724939 RepID=A0ABX1SC70_9PSEU|nr:hypothetical protein [Pseudonocardia acidicola]NMH98407.1 hypothetical protein [Pseudonocardia acidicola]
MTDAAVVSVLRAVWGATLLAVPGRLLRLEGQPRTSGNARAVLRILGLRHLGQAAVTVGSPRPRVLALGSATDGLHALTGVAFGAVAPRWRRVALLDTAIATGFAVAGALGARMSQRS